MNEQPASLEAGYLLKRAMTLLDTDRQVARHCLTEALALLGAQLEEPDPQVALDRYSWRPGGLPKWQARRAIEYIDANLGSKLQTARIARAVSLSPSHFSRAFRRAMACPPMAYVTVRRVELAKLMMKSTADRLANIAIACGFSDQSHFTKSFRRRVGVSPSTWRRRNASPC